MFDQIKDKPATGANNFVTAAKALPDRPASGRKKIIFLIIIFLIVLALLAIAGWRLWPLIKNKSAAPATGIATVSSTEPVRLDDTHLNGTEGDQTAVASSTEQSKIEYLSFVDFYQTPTDPKIEFKFAENKLPLNIKTEVSNYYEISRKLNLEKGIEALDKNGFVVMDNPWPKEAGNFYSLASSLDDKQIPLFISTDFISYYYQSLLKASFKEIEEGVFYESLRTISQSLYESARRRYETHLATVGNVNDRVLEGERLETAFFAVSLKLLEPRADQIAQDNQADSSKFTAQEQKQFAFSVPSYLNDDVLKELDLIRAAKEKKKSPVLLYDRDYSAFAVPAEYKNNARLQNFYLAAAWLNSVFPLNYREKACPECLLDKDDWRINFTAASLIAQDFSGNQELRSEWARVYKVISFFKGLRDTWNYVDYCDGLESLFGSDYDIVSLFAESNGEADGNMEKLRQALFKREILAMQGGLTIKNMAGYKVAGLQFLADSYWPNDFIFTSLRYPQVGAYQNGGQIGKNNITACSVQKTWQRCQGSGQDILSLVYPAWQGAAFLENSNYANYNSAINNLRPLVQKALNNNLNNYWSSLLISQAYLNTPAEHLPAYWQSSAWHSRMADSVLGSWIDMQLPLDKLNLKSQAAAAGTNLSSAASLPDYAWVEPNLEFFDRLLAHNQMLLGMFESLGINDRSGPAADSLREAGRELSSLRAIAVKEAQGETLVSDDTQIIRDFAKKYILGQSGVKSLSWPNSALKATIKETLGVPKLLIITHPAGEKTVFAVGPVFNYQESR